MFCIKCGEKLPENAEFCPKCGTRAILPEGEAPSAPDSRPVERPAAERECSEKNQMMVSVPGKGLYFITGGKRLCLLNQESNTVQTVVRESPDINLCGLGFSGGYLYYWQECRNKLSGAYGIHLYRMNPDTEEFKTVWECDEELFADYRLDEKQNRARAILWNGAYYLLNFEEQQMMRVTLPDGEWEDLELPDMRRRMPLYDWVEPRGVINLRSAEKNFGQLFSGFNLLDGRVFVSLDSCALCTLMFPLEHPEEFVYLPKNSAVAIQNGLLGGMLTSVEGHIVSCPGTAIGTGELGLYELLPDGNIVRMLSSTNDGVLLQNKGGYWWRLDGTLYLGTIAVDTKENKWHKLSPLLFNEGEFRHNVMGEVLDFFPGPGNSVYLLTRTSLYQVPQDWEADTKRIGDLKAFRITYLKDIK